MHFMQSAESINDERLVLLEPSNQLADSDYYVCQPIGPIGLIWSGPREVEIEFKRISVRKWRRGTNDVDTSPTIKHALLKYFKYGPRPDPSRLTDTVVHQSGHARRKLLIGA